MCNLYTPEPSRAVLAKLFNATWSDDASEWHEDAYPKYQAPIMRVEDGNRVLETMAWGVPITLPSKRPGTTITKHVTNVRNLQSSFWRSMLNEPSRRCLVPFKPLRRAKARQRRRNWSTSAILVHDQECPCGGLCGHLEAIGGWRGLRVPDM